MRKYHTPLGWPRRDPRHHRFPLPNSVWMYKLRPAEFVVLAYLCYRHSHSGTLAPTEKELAQNLSMGLVTVRKHLAALECKGLVTAQSSPAVHALTPGSKNFFTLPNEIFLLPLPSSAVMVYAYLLFIEDRRSHQCHPSYNSIAAHTGIAKNTAIKGIDALLEAGLITMEHSRYYDSRGMKWIGNNLYTILPVRGAVEAYHQRQLRRPLSPSVGRCMRQ